MHVKKLSPAFWTALMIAGFAFWTGGCSKSSGPEGGGGGGDTTPPSLTSITPIDNSHIEVKFNEAVDKITAEHTNFYDIHAGTLINKKEHSVQKSEAAFGDTLNIDTAALLLDGQTVLLSLSPTMTSGTPYLIIARSIKDLAGNAMSEPDTLAFSGINTPDTTPPSISDRTPTNGAGNVGIGQSVAVTFSEAMNRNSVLSAFSWTGPGGSVAFDMNTNGPNIFIFSPQTSLAYGTQYTVGFAESTAVDYSSNYLPASSWSFTTTTLRDNTPPTVVSTSPFSGELNVPLDKNLQITFSEPIDPNSLMEEGIFMTPAPASGVMTWTNGGKTLNYDPDSLFLDDTTYVTLVLKGALADYAGNRLASSYPFTFSTGSSIPTGGFSGKVNGDPNSSGASNPTGALVIAFFKNPFLPGGDAEMGGSAIAGTGGNYAIHNLEDAYYFPLAILDSNNDGKIDPEFGDAMGLYGLDLDTLQGDPFMDSVLVSGGSNPGNIDINIFDPVVISGRVSYAGTTHLGSYQNYNYYVGAFDTTGFDTTGVFPSPDYGTEGYMGGETEYRIGALGAGLTDGTYYLGAYLDVNRNYQYDPATDPAGFYTSGGNMVPVTVQNGSDAMHIDIAMDDPGALVASQKAISFRTLKRPRLERRRILMRRIFQAAREALAGEKVMK